MAATAEEILEKKEELSALKTAYNQSLSTGGVIEFRQGTTYLTKATTAELKKMKDATANELYRMENY